MGVGVLVGTNVAVGNGVGIMVGAGVGVGVLVGADVGVTVGLGVRVGRGVGVGVVRFLPQNQLNSAGDSALREMPPDDVATSADIPPIAINAAITKGTQFFRCFRFIQTVYPSAIVEQRGERQLLDFTNTE